MNSTIKQFAELSTNYMIIVVDGQMQSVPLIDPEKLADMIIFECTKIAAFNGDLKTARQIKEFFEVTE